MLSINKIQLRIFIRAWLKLPVNIGVGNKENSMTSKTLLLSIHPLSPWPLQHSLIFCSDDSTPRNVCLATFTFPNQLQQSPCKKKSKNKCLARKTQIKPYWSRQTCASISSDSSLRKGAAQGFPYILKTQLRWGWEVVEGRVKREEEKMTRNAYRGGFLKWTNEQNGIEKKKKPTCHCVWTELISSVFTAHKK